ncbi:MAG: 4Fe-4S dicluster domain-containing protein [Desulfosporosinus sp.]
MTKSWYPLIDDDNCIECGSCIDKCTHGVYDKDSEKPIVIYHEGCIEHCRGCQSLCPAEAIRYYGDTGGIQITCSCGGGC